MKSSRSFLVVFAITFGFATNEGWQGIFAQDAKTRFEVELKQNWTIEAIEGKPKEGIEIGRNIDAIVGREWEALLGDQFNGRAIYRTKIPAGLPRDRYACWLLEVEAAATHATVRIEGKEIGSHLGGWTPFRIDISRWIQAAAVDKEIAIEIEVDERVGHNTQGFLPIVVPHFGGIWKAVRLIGLPKSVYFNDLQLSVGGLAGKDQIALSVPLEGALGQGDRRFEVRWRVIEPTDDKPSEWQTAAIEKEKDVEKQELSERLIAKDVFVPKIVRHWSPEDPFRYDV
ncbi:MAG: Beta-galactosidase, partial [Planctomycetota bacterium]